MAMQQILILHVRRIVSSMSCLSESRGDLGRWGDAVKGLQENFLQEMGDGDKDVPDVAAWQSHRDPQGPWRVLTAPS